MGEADPGGPAGRTGGLGPVLTHPAVVCAAKMSAAARMDVTDMSTAERVEEVMSVTEESLATGAAVPAQRIGSDVQRARTSATAIARRGVDITGSAVLLLVLLPLFLVIILAIKLSTRGPAFYVKDRVGRGGEPFPFIKFRTMIPDADVMRSDVLGLPDEDMPERYREDPRITTVGRILRRWSLDELPQLVNVLRGDMSFVGPRPIIFDEVPLLKPWEHDRHLCRPGLTGLWQISGRKETTWEERIALDLEYVRGQSLRQDARIVWRTFAVVVRGDGAF